MDVEEVVEQLKDMCKKWGSVDISVVKGEVAVGWPPCYTVSCESYGIIAKPNGRIADVVAYGLNEAEIEELLKVLRDIECINILRKRG